MIPVGFYASPGVSVWHRQKCSIIMLDRFYFMDDDLKRGLLTKKVGFDKLYEDGSIRVAKIRQKNDAFQKHIGPDIDDQLREEIHEQSEYLEKQIKELKDLLNQMQSRFRDPESKNKIKQLKAEAHKQIERNKVILKDIINVNFLRKSKGSTGSKGKENEDNQRYLLGGVVNYNHLNGDENKGPKKQSVLTDPYEEQQQHIEIDYELERKLLLEKNQMINEVEQSTQRINDIINDMGVQIHQQGQNLDVISDELMTTNKNMVQTNEQLDEAIVLQRKSKKKYIFLVVLILLIILAVGGIIFFVSK